MVHFAGGKDGAVVFVDTIDLLSRVGVQAVVHDDRAARRVGGKALAELDRPVQDGILCGGRGRRVDHAVVVVIGAEARPFGC